ncbi:hypothetical protein EG832_05300, partial [bacterium]|nr:hypothetical protein [bacterium]
NSPTIDDSYTTDGAGIGSFTSIITQLTPNTLYYVRAHATNSEGTGYGNVVSFTTNPTVPGAPTGVTATAGNAQATVTFTAPASNGGSPITGYTVISSPGGIQSTGTLIPITITGLTNLTAYTFVVVATNINGNSAPSAASNSVIPGTVTNPTTGKIWMDRNLGANQVATSSMDAAAYGDLYQWGRGADGHQIRTSGTTTILSGTNSPGHGNFILSPASPYDWRSPQNDNLWQGVNGVNNPCPSGYRLPTAAEWDAERLSWGTNNAAGAFASPLKLPLAGGRFSSDGSLGDMGSSGRYWSSTISSTSSRSLNFNSSDAYMYSLNRASGFPVRCLKE